MAIAWSGPKRSGSGTTLEMKSYRFPCGYTLAPAGDTIRLYYGAADTSIALTTGRIQVMLDWLEKQG